MDHFILDSNLNQWEDLPSLPTTKFNRAVGTAIDSHRMIVIESQDFIGCKSKCFMYDMRNFQKPELNKWIDLPHPPGPEVQAATSIDGKLVILNKVENCNEKSESNQLHLFNVDKMAWSKLPPTIHKRDHCALVSHGRYIYAFGGFQYHYTPGMGFGYGLSKYP